MIAISATTFELIIAAIIIASLLYIAERASDYLAGIDVERARRRSSRAKHVKYQYTDREAQARYNTH